MMQPKIGLALSIGIASAGIGEFFITDRFFDDGLVLQAVLALGGILLVFLGVVVALAYLVLWYFELALNRRLGVQYSLVGLGSIACGLYPSWQILSDPYLKVGGVVGQEARVGLVLVSPILLVCAIFVLAGAGFLRSGLRQFHGETA